VAAASIVAKVIRDREMEQHHVSDPRYGYDKHKGYATREHLAAVSLHGYSPLHRRSFRPAAVTGLPFDDPAAGDLEKETV
jgi:ribonuclease HII